MIVTRWRRSGVAVALAAAACAAPQQVPPTASTPGGVEAAPINPGNIARVAAEFPVGHEIGAVARGPVPPAVWGLSDGWGADPSQCGVLADPFAGRAASSRGLSGSGPGGISYAVVTASPAGPLALDVARVAGCAHWTMSQGHTTVRVHLVDAPPIDHATTLGMVSEISTVVEGGSEIVSHADTFAAYLGDYYAFTVLVADPGAQHPALDSRFAADLLVKTVAALRG